MDPNTPGAEEHGQTPSRRPPRDPLATDLSPSTPAVARTTRIVSGDFLLTVNPVDGSEIEPCPPGTPETGTPRKRTAAERADAERAAQPLGPVDPVPAGDALLERAEVREDLVRLLARGRSVRLTGPAGSGRTALLDLVAEDCQDLAPDGVVRLTGFHRTATDLLRDLFHTVYAAPRHRPEPEELLGLVREIGAVVVVDDLELGGAALAELLEATPECAYLLGALPDLPAPAAGLEVAEAALPGLDRAAGVEILERTVGRALTEEESVWAGDLWFESEGLPLRFVQAGALLRQREQLRAGAGVVDEYGVFQDVRPQADAAFDVPLDEDEAEEVPLPSLAEAASAAPLLASRLSTSARATLRFATVLDGEVPHQAHLPALVGDTHADAALAELTACGLVTRAGSRYRLAADVRTQLEAAGYAEAAGERALTAARHYAWWAAHPSVAPERVCAEADAVLAALDLLAPAGAPPAPDAEAAEAPEPAEPVEGRDGAAVRLAHAAGAAFAAGLHWNAWERALHRGAESARLAGDPTEQGYFHHELGILALCGGQLDLARAELGEAIALRSSPADKRGTVAGRRALALVADRSGDLPALAAPLQAATARREDTVPVVARGSLFDPGHGVTGPVTVGTVRAAAAKGGGLRGIARRNLVAAGSGALLVAVLGTVVTLGMTSRQDTDRDPAGSVEIDPSATQGLGDATLGAAPKKDATSGKHRGRPSANPTGPGPDGAYGTSDDPVPPAAPGTTEPARHDGSETTGGGHTTSRPSRPAPGKSSHKPSPTPTKPTPSTSKPTTPSSPPVTPPGGSSSPSTSTSASGPAGVSASPSGGQAASGTPQASATGTVI